MNKSYLLWLPAIPLAASLLTGCIDNNYDLSDIDTTTKIAVKDLVIPVNLEPVKLNSVIKLDEGGSIVEEDYDGSNPEMQGKKMYVFRHSGTFTSDPIHIHSFHVNSPDNLTPAQVEISMSQSLSSPLRLAAPSDPTAIKYDIKDVTKSFSYHIENIDAKIESVNSIRTPEVLFSTTLTVPASVMADLQQISIENLKMVYPKGLTLSSGMPAEVLVDGKTGYGSYDPASGLVTMTEYDIIGTDKWTLTLRAQDIDINSMGAVLNNHTFDYDGEIDVQSGVLYIVPKAGKIPASRFYVETSYNLSSFDIEDFTGKINYTLDDLDFEDVSLDDIPSFLDQPETRIRIANPQLYLSFYNSCAQYGLGGHSGLSITPVRNGVAGNVLTMNEPVVIGDNKGYGPYKYAISPQGSALNPISQYSDAEKLLFADFGDVLYGDGIPTALKVDFDDPAVSGTATHFPLQLPGRPENEWEIDPVHGSYEFRAPLALSDGSVIGYSGTEDDWDSEELEDLHIQYVEITADATSNIPLDVDLSAVLLDVNGNHLGYCLPVALPAMASNAPISITITYKKNPSSTDLKDPAEEQYWLSAVNGIRYEVTARSQANEGTDTPLSPDQTITLSNLKAKVNGYYLHVDENYEEYYK